MILGADTRATEVRVPTSTTWEGKGGEGMGGSMDGWMMLGDGRGVAEWMVKGRESGWVYVSVVCKCHYDSFLFQLHVLGYGCR